MIVERQVKGHSLRAECRVGTRAQLTSVLDTFERVEAPQITAALEIRFGWSLLRLQQDGNALRVTEPDFDAWPHQQYNPTLDVTLRVVGEQANLLQRLGVAGEDTYFDQMVVTAPGALSAREVFLRRVEPISDADSGWLLGTTQDPEALTREVDLEAVPSAALVALYPALLAAMVLPRGFVAIFRDNLLTQVFDADGQSRALT
jgi:hypothetical protein